MNNDFIKHSQGYGFVAPFCMLLMSIVWIYETPTNTDGMKIVTGDIKQQVYFKDIILLKDDDTKYVIASKTEEVKQILDRKKTASIWVIENEELDQKVIQQLELDGELVIEYNYLKKITFSIVFGVIGLLLIPSVIRAKRKQIAEERYHP